MEILVLPADFMSASFTPPTEAPCIIQILCDKHDGLFLEAKGIKEHWWKPRIKKLIEKEVCTQSQVVWGGGFGCYGGV